MCQLALFFRPLVLWLVDCCSIVCLYRAVLATDLDVSVVVMDRAIVNGAILFVVLKWCEQLWKETVKYYSTDSQRVNACVRHSKAVDCSQNLLMSPSKQERFLSSSLLQEGFLFLLSFCLLISLTPFRLVPSLHLPLLGCSSSSHPLSLSPSLSVFLSLTLIRYGLAVESGCL